MTLKNAGNKEKNTRGEYPFIFKNDVSSREDWACTLRLATIAIGYAAAV